MPKTNRLPSISLFSGAFGLDLGLEKAGFEVRACVEKNPHCVQTIIKNKPHLSDLIINKDINDVSSNEILKIAKLKRGQAFLVAGGPPCQPFSTAGRRGSISSEEGQLFRKFLQIVWEIYPRYFIFENVKGILSAAIKHKSLELRNKKGELIEDREKLGSGWDFINEEFSKKLKKGKKGGYKFNIWELNSADFGVPQKRKRVFIVGTRETKNVIKMPNGKFRNKPKTLRQAIGKLNGHNECAGVDYYPYDPLRYEIFKKGLIKAGENWTALPVRLQKKVMGKGWYATGGKVGFCRRLSWDKPSPTITTHPVGRATNLGHPDKPRSLNFTECAIIQGFPRNWKFEGPLNQKFIQIGNAVPVKLGKAIGKELIQAIRMKSAKD